MSFTVNTSDFDKILDKSNSGSIGVVITGVNKPSEWIVGLTQTLFDERVVSSDIPENAWSGFDVLTAKDGSNTLIFWFNNSEDSHSRVKIFNKVMEILMYDSRGFWVSDLINVHAHEY